MRRSSLYSPNLGYAVILLLLLFCLAGCDLFNSTKEDELLAQIDAEIAWANAPKLTVTVAYPVDWGSSPQNGTGRCFDNKRTSETPRKGYEFTVEFTPSAAYNLVEWRAYATSALPANWRDNPGPAYWLEGEGGQVDQIKGISIPRPEPNGGAISFSIDTTESVTLIPWCKDLPRITMATPANGGIYSRDQNITITFAAPIRQDSVLFGGDYITITMRDPNDPDDEGAPIVGDDVLDPYYDDPEWDPVGQRTITIEPIGAGPLGDRIITVTIGTGIRSALGNNGMAEPVVFSWTTQSASSISVGEYYAICNDAGNAITVHWTREGGDAPARIRYSMNYGYPQTEVTDDTSSSVTISVPVISAGGVTSGQLLGNIHQYEIYIELLSGISVIDSKGPLRIWNVPKMNVNNSNTVLLTQAKINDLSAVNSDGKNFVLAENITLPDSWEPVGTSATPFRGKFYGNGQTITMAHTSDNGFANAAYTGIFGYVNGSNSEIRDLAVYYAANATAGASATHVGGLAGYVGGGAKLRNIIVRGAGGITLRHSNTVSSFQYYGGIVGRLIDNGTELDNAYSDLSISFSSSNSTSTAVGANQINDAVYAGGITGLVQNAKVMNCMWAANANLDISRCAKPLYAGGIAGKFYSTQSTPAPVLDNVIARGNISVDNAEHLLQLGGLIGQATGTAGSSLSINNSRYESGHIRATCYGGRYTLTSIGGFAGTVGALRYNIVIGGAITYGEDYNVGPVITGCQSRAAGITVSYLGSGPLTLGGFSGFVFSTNIDGCVSESPMTLLKSGDVWDLLSGGFVGLVLSNTQPLSITNCRASSSLSLDTKGQNEVNSGGFVGYIFTLGGNITTISQCYASGDVYVKAGTQAITGGFAGYIRVATINRCRADGNVTVQAAQGRGNQYLYAGGLVGYNSMHTIIEDSYTLGNVEVDDPYIDGSHLYVGGVAGHMAWPDPGTVTNRITRCFAKGMVTAQAAGNKQVFAAGIVGVRAAGSIQYCVALNEGIYAKGTGAYAASRIYAYPRPTDLNPNIGTNNLGLNPMRLENWAVYSNPTSAQITSVTPVSLSAGQHGFHVTAAELTSSNLWTLRGFTAANGWSTNGISRGYPRLSWEF